MAVRGDSFSARIRVKGFFSPERIDWTEVESRFFDDFEAYISKLLATDRRFVLDFHDGRKSWVTVNEGQESKVLQLQKIAETSNRKS
ncbi:hypothetical protein Mal15_42460 [Stieleria maiorica]|uniref:Uncharacterized protein n=2 Tax=Stieleria maiorica TaxID=2795974 RepID=A0A5B9MJH7_9BACT|nr:hypothetical protein Mal15_42460 [Stieleria maiorica]